MLILVVVGALFLMSVLQRRPGLPLRFGPLFVIAAAGIALLYGGRLLIAPGTGALGAYGESVGSGYQPGEVLRWAVREAGDVFLLVVGLPLIGAFCLAIAHLRSRTRDPKVSALLAVTFSFGLLSVVQVGAFASLHVHQLAERDLITVAPPIFVTFTVWLGRGMPRPQPVTSIAACVVLACAVFLPVGKLVTDKAVPDALMTSPLVELAKVTSDATLVTIWGVVAGALVLLAVLIPRKAAPGLPAIVYVALLGSSVAAEHEMYVRSQFDRSDFFGRSPTGWIDEHAAEDATYLDEGDPLWNAFWQQAFWNERLRSVATLKINPQGPQFGIPRVVVGEGGQLRRTDGEAFTTHLFVAPKPLTLKGKRVAEIHQGRDEPGLVLWRVQSVPTLSYTTTGVHPNTGDVLEEIDVNVFACGRGSLDLTLFAKQGVPGMKQGTPGLFLQSGNERPTQIIVSPGLLWRLRIPTPPTADGEHRCLFRIGPAGAVSIASLTFRRGSRTPPGAAYAPRLGIEHDGGLGEKGRSLPTARDVVYCLYGRELRLLPHEPTSNLMSREGSLAVFIAGKVSHADRRRRGTSKRYARSTCSARRPLCVLRSAEPIRIGGSSSNRSLGGGGPGRPVIQARSSARRVRAAPGTPCAQTATPGGRRQRIREGDRDDRAEEEQPEHRKLVPAGRNDGTCSLRALVRERARGARRGSLGAGDRHFLDGAAGWQCPDRSLLSHLGQALFSREPDATRPSGSSRRPVGAHGMGLDAVTGRLPGTSPWYRAPGRRSS